MLKYFYLISSSLAQFRQTCKQNYNCDSDYPSCYQVCKNLPPRYSPRSVSCENAVASDWKCKFPTVKDDCLQYDRNLGLFCSSQDKTIHLAFLGITKLESFSFDGMKKWSAKHLYLQKNAISYIDIKTFAGFTTLEHLDLSTNRISSISRQHFSDLRSLEYLYLEDNQLLSLDPLAFQFMPALKKIRLNNNRIKILPVLPKNLEYISVLNTNITALESNLFQELYNLSVIRSDKILNLPDICTLRHPVDSIQACKSCFCDVESRNDCFVEELANRNNLCASCHAENTIPSPDFKSCQCKENFFEKNGVCKPVCTSLFDGVLSCKKCGDVEKDKCLICTDPNAEPDEEGICTCKPHFYNKENGSGDFCSPDCRELFSIGISKCNSCQSGNYREYCQSCSDPNAGPLITGKGCECIKGFYDLDGVCKENCISIYSSGVESCTACLPFDQEVCMGCKDPNAIPKKEGDGCECKENFFPKDGVCTAMCTEIYSLGIMQCASCDDKASQRCKSCAQPNTVVTASGMGCTCAPGFYSSESGLECLPDCVTQFSTDVEQCKKCRLREPESCSECMDPNAVVKNDGRGCECKEHYYNAYGTCYVGCTKIYADYIKSISQLKFEKF